MTMEGKSLGFMRKPEVTYAVDPTPTPASNGLMVKNFVHDDELSEVEKQRMGARPRSAGTDPGKYKTKWKCEVPLQGPPEPDPGDPYPAPAWLSLFAICGMVITTSGTPVDTHTIVYDTRVAQASMTFYHWFIKYGTKDALQTKIHGARAVHSWQVGINEEFLFTFEGEGIHGGTSDISSFTEPTYQDIVEADDAANGKAMTVTIGGVSTDCTMIKFKSNRTIANEDSVQSATGLKEVLIDMKAGANFEFEMDRVLELKAVRDDLGDWLAGGTVKVAWEILIVTAGGMQFRAFGDRLQTASFKRSMKDGLWRVDGKFYPCDSTARGDNAITYEVKRAA